MSEKGFKAALIVLSMLTLAGCFGVPVKGETTTSRTLQADVLGYIKLIGSQQGCDSVDSVVSKVDRVSDDLDVERGTGEIEETWAVKQCGKHRNYTVVLKPDGNGGSFYSVRMQR